MARNRRHFREIFHVEAQPKDYYYVLLDQIKQGHKGLVGYVLNDSSKDIRIAIDVDDDYLLQQKAIYPLLYVDPEDYSRSCSIVINGEMLMNLNQAEPDLEVLFGIWHEVGLFHNMEEHIEEYLSYANKNDGGMTANQYLALLNEELLPFQEASDAFAQDYMGLPNTIIALNGMLARAKKNPLTKNDRSLHKELLNRKKCAMKRGGMKEDK